MTTPTRHGKGAELYVGAANALCPMLSMSEWEDKIRGACVALERRRRAIGNAEDTVLAIPGCLLHTRRIPELRLPLAGHPVMGGNGGGGNWGRFK